MGKHRIEDPEVTGMNNQGQNSRYRRGDERGRRSNQRADGPEEVEHEVIVATDSGPASEDF
jgi:hypothetical protein